MIPRIIVHGGAFNIPDSYLERYKRGVTTYASVGYEKLKQGCSAVDAVEAVVRLFEDDSAFNAGRGSAMTTAGTVEMDAIIMDGKTMKTGGVAAVELMRHPVSLARKVMDETTHCLLAGSGAMKFARDQGVEIVPADDLVTDDSIWKSFLMGNGTYDAHIQALVNTKLQAGSDSDLKKAFHDILKERPITKNGHDTVGAVAIDCHGNIACATSTGGMPGKMLGRVGDSPLIGCGGYANEVGGCSTTGHGESLIRSMLAREAVRNLEQGCTTMEAAEKAIEYMHQVTEGGRGGLIILDNKGNIGYAFNSQNLAWAAKCNKGLVYGLKAGDFIKE